MGRRKEASRISRSVSKGASGSKQAAAPKRAAKPALPPAGDSRETPRGRIVERPDGFYWESKGERAEYGPFQTLAEAEANMLAGGAEGEEAEPGDSLQEAESELGIAEWIDPDTGGPAEDSVPRIEDH